MSDDGHKTEQRAGTRSHVPASETTGTGGRAIGFDCCGSGMGDAVANCPCTSAMRRHPVIAFVILAVMGLAFLAIPTGFILGILAFMRTT